MGKGRIVFFIVLIAAGCALSVLFFRYKPTTPLRSSLAPMYQLFGHIPRGLSQVLTQVVRVDSLDEKEYGDAIKMQCDGQVDENNADMLYVNSVMSNITRYSKKPFGYRVYINNSDDPNAFALPGGVIFVSQGLLENLDSESELAAILAHEMGHIELSHCLDLVRFELATRKIGQESLGKIADMAMAVLLRHSFSKTQEDDADTYAFEVLKNSTYDPSAEGRAFEFLIAYGEKYGYPERQKADVMRDYFMSHPPLAIRAEKFNEKARIWWKGHPHERRYRGKKNLKDRLAERFDNEYVEGGTL